MAKRKPTLSAGPPPRLYNATTAAQALAQLGGKPISPRRVRELAAAAQCEGLTLVDLVHRAGYVWTGAVPADRFYTDADLAKIAQARGPGRNRQTSNRQTPQD